MLTAVMEHSAVAETSQRPCLWTPAHHVPPQRNPVRSCDLTTRHETWWARIAKWLFDSLSENHLRSQETKVVRKS